MTARGWLLLIYRVPRDPTKVRVWTWRELKRIGALYLQHGVCIVPALPECVRGIEEIATKIDEKGGSHLVIPIPVLPLAEEASVIAGFRELAAEDYGEIIDACETQFAKKLEFERFRGELTYESTEELREDLEKIRHLFERAKQRDWFGDVKRQRVEEAIATCQTLLEAFEEEVYAKAELPGAARRAAARPPTCAGSTPDSPNNRRVVSQSPEVPFIG